LRLHLLPELERLAARERRDSHRCRQGLERLVLSAWHRLPPALWFLQVQAVAAPHLLPGLLPVAGLPPQLALHPPQAAARPKFHPDQEPLQRKKPQRRAGTRLFRVLRSKPQIHFRKST